jgi:regulator of sigma E protease
MPDFIGLGNGVINVVLLLVILVILVLIHEFGHFLVARRAGVTVHEFGVGFPPRAKVLGTDRQGTTYTLNWLPIGGFVKLEGEEGQSDDPHAFSNQRLRTRLAILLAGVTMNIVLAFVIFAFIAAFADPVANARISFVTPDSPAAGVGLVGGNQIDTDPEGNPIYDETGDLIVAIDGQRFPVFDWNVGGVPQSTYLRSHSGQTVILTIRRNDGTERDVSVTLRPAAEITPTKGALGVQFNALPTENVQHGPVDALTIGFRRTVDAATLILRGLGDLIVNITNPQVSGPIWIVGAIGTVRTELPPVFLLWFVGLLSANLAVVNALPFPPLDGGRVAVAIIQRLTGNRISVAAERLAYLTGFVLLMALLAWVTFFDIQRLG